MSKIANALKSYEDKEGYSPVSGLIDTLTFAKSIPVYIGMTLVISAFIFITYNVINWVFMGNAFLSILFTIGSLLGTIYVAIMGFFYFLMVNMIDGLQNLVVGTLKPIERVYEKWSDKTTMSKKDFILAVLKEEVFPSLLSNWILRRYKVRISSHLDGIMQFADKQADENDDADSLGKKFESFFKKQNEAVTKSYVLSLKIYGVFFIILVLFILI